MSVDRNLEGYWERAYWEIVPKLQRALEQQHDVLTYAEMWAWHEAIAETIHKLADDGDPHRFGPDSADCDWLADQIIEATGGHRLLPSLPVKTGAT